MKLKTDIFSRAILKPLFNSIANSNLGRGCGVIGPHEEYEADLVIAGVKPIALLYEYINKDDDSLSIFFNKTLIEYNEYLKDIPKFSFTEKLGVKKIIKYLHKNIDDLNKLDKAVNAGTILKKTFRDNNAEGAEENQSYLEEYYFQHGQEDNVEKLIRATKQETTGHIAEEINYGKLLGYNEIDIKRFNDNAKNYKEGRESSPIEDKINDIKRWCRIRSLLIK